MGAEGETGALFPELEREDAAPATDDSPDAGGAWLVRVALKVPLDTLFDYRVPSELRDQVEVGRRCKVPFGPRKLIGYIVELPETTETPTKKMRRLLGLVDPAPVFDADMLALCQWIARYYACSLGEVLETALPAGMLRRRKTRDVLASDAVLVPATPAPEGKPGKRGAELLELVRARPEGVTVEALMESSGAARGTVKRLVKKGFLVEKAPEEVPGPFEKEVAPELTDEQQEAVEAIVEDLESGEFCANLLFGVTGSGKTEVYLRVIERCLALGRGAIVLVPEIALTPQTTRRFRARFGDEVAVLHSRLSSGERHEAWRRAREGEARVAIGPRSALFAPIRNLGLIVVDEEHETSYKQERAPRYHARDVAVVLARRRNATVVLGSATPSLESFNNAMAGRYQLLELTRRAGGADLPPVEIVDMGVEWRAVKGAPLISRRLKTVVTESLERDERAILFLNRRGFTTFLNCKRCGYVHKCPSCDVALTFHKRLRQVLCHFCAEALPPPSGPCPSCLGPPLTHRGAGTERIEEACREAFPMARIERVDSDTVRAGDPIEEKLGRFRRGDTNLIIGTQMIARGLDIPEVTAVGIINADTSLGHPDFRATERTFQLVAQVAGRAGRGHRPGRTIVQTFNPSEASIQAAAKHAYLEFAEREASARKMLGYPPFGRLLHILLRGEEQEQVGEEARRLCDWLRDRLPENTSVLGPAVSPRAYLANRYRFQALVKARTPGAIALLMRIIRDYPAPRDVEVVLDRDPVFLL